MLVFVDMLKDSHSEMKKVIDRIRKMPVGACFSRSDFADIGSRLSISQSLSRLERARALISPLRGYYCCRRVSKLLGEELPVDYPSLAEAIARNSGWMIIPCGDIAANDLGLSTQVPAVWSYASTGPSHEYVVGKMTLAFKHTANREMFSMSRKSALCVQAIKSFGKDGVTSEVILRLGAVLSERERKALLAETTHVTSWIYDVFKKLGEEMLEVQHDN